MTEVNSMGVPKPKFRASFSQWEAYDQCPQKWKYSSVLKLPRQPPGPAAARGLHMHDRVERYILGHIDDVNGVYPEVDDEYRVKLGLQPGDPLLFGDKKPAPVHRKYIPILDAFRNHPNGDRHTEKKVAFDSEWYLCGTSSPHAAFVAILDAARVGGDRYDKNDEDNGVVRIGEWKSGKPKPTHADQRSIYSMVGWRLWLGQTVEVTTYYLEDTSPPERLVMRSEEGYQRQRAKWDGRVKEMATNEICAPRPGFHCNWCDFAKRRGGPCPFGG